jgi:hypothetical protein
MNEENIKKKNIRRIDVDPTDDQLIEFIKNDSIGRNKDLYAFLSMLNAIDDGYTFFIDGKWGDGKTVFVRQSIMMIEHLNPMIIRNDVTFEDSIESQFQHPNDKFSLLPVYYNAWENDSYGDPLLSLISTIVTTSDDSLWDGNIKDKTHAATTIIDSVCGILRMNMNISGIVDAIKGESILNSYREIRTINEKLGQLFDAIKPEKANKIVIFIDELDRCNPRFALQVLERTKHLFTRDDIIIVFSLNTEQLSHTIEGYYGVGFDAHAYLSRFYDQKVTLTHVDSTEYLSMLGIVEDNIIDLLSKEITHRKGMTMRECNKYFNLIEEAKKSILGINNIQAFAQTLKFFDHIMLPILIAIYVQKPDLYTQISSGNKYEVFKKYYSESDTVAYYAENFLNPKDKDIGFEEYFKQYYNIVFDSAQNSDTDAQSNVDELGSCSKDILHHSQKVLGEIISFHRKD